MSLLGHDDAALGGIQGPNFREGGKFFEKVKEFQN